VPLGNLAKSQISCSICCRDDKQAQHCRHREWTVVKIDGHVERLVSFLKGTELLQVFAEFKCFVQGLGLLLYLGASNSFGENLADQLHS